jgi:zinc transport system substrate-binding protein
MLRTAIHILTSVALATAVGCGQAHDAAPGGRLTVAVSIIPQTWLVRKVGGDRVEPMALVAPGENPHTYQPTDAQVSRLMRAAVFFRIGAPFENGPWFQAIQSAPGLKIVDLRQGIALREMAEADHANPGRNEEADEHGKDPHIWLSPRLLKIQATSMARTLGQLDPAHQGEYQRNLHAVVRELDDLDRAIAAKLAASRGKPFFVFHPAWGYFADDYGLRQVAVEVEGKDPTDQELTEVQRAARRAGAQIILVQPEISGRSARAVAAATGARVESADPLAYDVPASLLKVAGLIAAAVKKQP